MTRRKKLAALDYLDGNPSRRLIAESGIEAVGEPFVANNILPEAKSCVMAVMSSMPPGVYRKMDSFLLAAYGMAWAMHVLAVEAISRPDFMAVVSTGNGTLVKSPWLQILDNQADKLNSLGARLGLDPIARQGLHLPEQRSKSRFRGLIGPEIEQPASSPSLKNSPSRAESDKESPSI